MRHYRSLVALAVLALGSSASLRAADTQVLPSPVPPPGTMPVAGCASCAAAASAPGGCKTCQSCGSSWFHHHDKGPYVVNLCPGACFGYFQTQWRKWDDVCPYPYQGVGVSDAPRAPSPVLPGTPTAPAPGGIKPGSTLPGPRPVETNPKTSDSKPMSTIVIPAMPSSTGGF